MHPRLKLIICSLLQWLPGKAGETWETRALWARRQLRARSSGGDFERELARLDGTSICLDLGANVGDVTERLAAVAGHVHAFEPDPWAFAQLRERAKGWRNVTLHNAAIGPQDGTMTMLRDPGFDHAPQIRSQGTSAFASLLWENGEPQRFEVEVVGLHRFLQSLDAPVALMKVDIEGAEVDLVNSLIDSPERERVGVMFIETHECQIPALRRPTRAMRARLARLEAPKCYLEWH
mgnify:CR=1 FL=1